MTLIFITIAESSVLIEEHDSENVVKYDSDKDIKKPDQAYAQEDDYEDDDVENEKDDDVDDEKEDDENVNMKKNSDSESVEMMNLTMNDDEKKS